MDPCKYFPMLQACEWVIARIWVSVQLQTMAAFQKWLVASLDTWSHKWVVNCLENLMRKCKAKMLMLFLFVRVVLCVCLYRPTMWIRVTAFSLVSEHLATTYSAEYNIDVTPEFPKACLSLIAVKFGQLKQQWSCRSKAVSCMFDNNWYELAD